jgi:hypothetical protein
MSILSLLFRLSRGNVRFGARIARHNNLLYKKKAKSVNISAGFQAFFAVWRRLARVPGRGIAFGKFLRYYKQHLSGKKERNHDVGIQI